jgi:hypothetical protein
VLHGNISILPSFQESFSVSGRSISCFSLSHVTLLHRHSHTVEHLSVYKTSALLKISPSLVEATPTPGVAAQAVTLRLAGQC